LLNCVTCIGPGAKPSLQVHSKPPSTFVQVPLPQIFFTDMHSLSSGIKDTNLLPIYQFHNVREVTENWITRSDNLPSACRQQRRRNSQKEYNTPVHTISKCICHPYSYTSSDDSSHKFV